MHVLLSFKASGEKALRYVWIDFLGTSASRRSRTSEAPNDIVYSNKTGPRGYCSYTTVFTTNPRHPPLSNLDMIHTMDVCEPIDYRAPPLHRYLFHYVNGFNCRYLYLYTKSTFGYFIMVICVLSHPILTTLS